MKKRIAFFALSSVFLFLCAFFQGCRDNVTQEISTASDVSTVLTLRTLQTSEQQFLSFKKKHDSVGFGLYGNFEELKQAGLFSIPSSHERSGYHYEIKLLDGGKKFQITALPLHVGETGQRSFFMDETGRITFRNDGKKPSASDPVMD